MNRRQEIALIHVEEGCSQQPWSRDSAELPQALKEFAGTLLLVLCEPRLLHTVKERKKVLCGTPFLIVLSCVMLLLLCMEAAAPAGTRPQQQMLSRGVTRCSASPSGQCSSHTVENTDLQGYSKQKGGHGMTRLIVRKRCSHILQISF